ncbi:TPA: restriction endonuclease subunit S [Vibrio parahaemolyticus]|nr:restriction endonuclease subunit S [Vibrio parahaemolyticus]HCG8202535.1 restriction endonuclease subunit S [Vibrio parahaemolyticus]
MGGLPKGWVNVSIDDITSDVSYGVTAKSNPVEGDLQLLRITDIQDNKVDWSTVPYCAYEAKYESSRLKNDDIVVARTGATVGKSFLIENAVENSVYASYLIRLRLAKGALPKYLASFLRTPSYWQQISEQKAGIGQPNVNGTKLKTLQLPLAPLPEQKRIVEKLDEVLAQVDTIKARLDGIPDLLKRFRQSVLASAVSGKLTEEWRGGGLINWEQTVFGDLLLASGNGLSKRKGNEGKNVTVLRLADFKNAQRTYGNERQIILTDKECEKYLLSPGDILAIRVNGSIDLAGKFICYQEKDKTEAFCDHFIRFSLDGCKIVPEFMLYVANEGEGRHYLQNSLSTSAGQNTINQKSIKALKINLPSLVEQKEIVRLVDQYFAFADTIEAQVKKAQQRVDNLTQSILAKAFRGELVAQDPNDEPADKLLERIAKARAEAEVLAKAAKKAEAAKKRAAKA